MSLFPEDSCTIWATKQELHFAPLCYNSIVKPRYQLQSQQFKDVIKRARGDGSYENAATAYRPLIIHFARQIERPRLLEIGGGRAPLLSEPQIDLLHGKYTVNDIDANELALAPAWVERLHGDIADPNTADPAKHTGLYDLAFSQMVFEHIENPSAAYRNIARLLAPGGILINFMPTLYAPPFVLNRLLPERLSSHILKTAFPNRNPHEFPKFPAYYRWCTTTKRTQKKIASAGFSDVAITPFYGHGYYAKIPILRGLSRHFWPLAEQHNWRALSTYAYVICER